MTPDDFNLERAATASAFRALRALADLTQPELAEKMSASAHTVRAIEHGEVASPQRWILPLCNAVGATLDDWKDIVSIARQAALRRRLVEPRELPSGAEAPL